MKRGVHGPLARSENSPPPKLVYEPPADNGLDIIHQDDDILVLGKPAGLLSVPGNRPDLQDSIETRAQARFPTATTVHRLDRPTSGVFLMALNARAHRIIGRQFEQRRTAKSYCAVVDGVVDDENGVIDQPLRTDWYNRPKQMVDACLGREAITKWHVCQRYSDRTRLNLEPVTGRSHQLRVHLQWLGHPILGDEFYAPFSAQQKSGRLMLHAQFLEIRHPGTNERTRFVSPCDF